ncbi:MAG: FMN-binding protein, partial [Bacteroidota bacterium]|nr:FMN-binding protein [Bacteroidota bacterium]
EEIMNGTQYEGITVAKGNNDPLNDRKDDGKVDAIAGATITGNGVTAMINSTVKLYIPYLKDIKL